MTCCLIIQTSWPKQRRVRLFNIHIVKQKQLGRFFLHHIFNLLQIRKTLQLILFQYGFSALSSIYHTFSVYDNLKFCFRNWSEALWHIDFYMEQSLFRKPSLRCFQWSTAKCQEHIREQCCSHCPCNVRACHKMWKCFSCLDVYSNIIRVSAEIKLVYAKLWKRF